MHPAMQGDQFAERGTGHVGHVFQADDKLPTAVLLDQIEQVLAQHVDVLLLRQLRPGDRGDDDAVPRFQLQKRRLKIGNGHGQTARW